MWIKAALAVFLAAASTHAAAEEKAFASLDGTFWRLQNPPRGLEHLSIAFHDSLMMQAAPCDFADDQFTVKDAQLSLVGEIGSGENVAGECGDELDAFPRFSLPLQYITSYRRRGDDLDLFDAKGTRTVLTRIQPEGLEYRRYAIVAYRDSGKLMRVLALQGTPTIFFASGQLASASGCALWYGTYIGSGDLISGIDVPPYASVECPGDKFAERQEIGLVRALGKSRRAQALPAGGFNLRDENGDVQLTLSPIKPGAFP